MLSLIILKIYTLTLFFLYNVKFTILLLFFIFKLNLYTHFLIDLLYILAKLNVRY